MKYLLKQNKEDKGILCDKVTIDGFDYYVSDEELLPCIPANICMAHITKLCDKCGRYQGKKVIATNNPNIDIPKVKEMSDYLAKELNKQSFDDYGFPEWDEGKLFHRQMGFIDGYNKSQEAHPFTEEDVRWIFAKAIELSPSTESHTRMINDEQYRNHVLDSLYVKVLQLWQEQQPKIVYYE